MDAPEEWSVLENEADSGHEIEVEPEPEVVQVDSEKDNVLGITLIKGNLAPEHQLSYVEVVPIDSNLGAIGPVTIEQCNALLTQEIVES